MAIKVKVFLQLCQLINSGSDICYSNVVLISNFIIRLQLEHVSIKTCLCVYDTEINFFHNKSSK